MYFTREDILKILKALLQIGTKDSEFKNAQLPLLEQDVIAVVQDGANRKVKISDIIGLFNLLNRLDFINVSDMYDEHYITINEAIKLIPLRKRKEGLVITFQNTSGKWQIYQFKGTTGLFVNPIYWEDLFSLEYPIINSIIPDEEDLTISKPDEDGNSLLSFKDKDYDPEGFSGMATKILRKHIVEVDDSEFGKIKKNILYQDDFNLENCIYEIKYDFDLNNLSINIPNNCILKFNGGSFSNGTIIGLGTDILAGNFKIFNINLLVRGTWRPKLNVCWYGAIPSNVVDYTDIGDNIQMALDSSFDYVFFPIGYYYTTKTLIIRNRAKYVILEGTSNSELYKLVQLKKYYLKAACIYTNLDIDLIELRINAWNGLSTSLSLEGDSTVFTGGQLDVSLCGDYTHTCLKVVKAQFVFTNVNIKTSIISKGKNFIDNNINYDNISKGIGIYENNDISRQSLVFATFDCFIYGFDIGFYTGPTEISGSWMTTVSLKGVIHSCNVAVKLLSSCFSGGEFSSILQLKELPYVPILLGDFGDVLYNGYIWDMRENHIIMDAKALLSLLFNDRMYSLFNYDYDITYDGYIKGGLASNKSSYNALSITPMLLPEGNSFNTLSLHFNESTQFNDWKNLDVMDPDVSITHEEQNLTFSKESSTSMFSIIGKEFSFTNVEISENAKFKITIDISKSYKNLYTAARSIIIRFNNNAVYLNFKRVKVTIEDSKGNIRNVCNGDINYYTSTKGAGSFGRDQIIIYTKRGVDNVTLTKINIEFMETINTKNTIWIQISATNSSYVNSGYRLKGELIYNIKDKNFYLYENSKYLKVTNGLLSNKFGTSNIRPTNVDANYLYFDTSINKPIWWTGTEWLDARGENPDKKTSGTTVQRPTEINEGFEYYDSTLKKKILWNGTSWVNIDGTTLE